MSLNIYVGNLYYKHQKNKMKLLEGITFVVIYIAQAICAAVELDKEHLDIYPFCGKLFGYEKHDASSRIVNSKESEIQYPWVVYLQHSFLTTDAHQVLKVCSGTVIGER